MENANSHPIKAVITEDSDLFANSHPYKVEVIAGDDLATKDYVDEQIKGIVEVVDELPETGEQGILYYVPKTGETDTYDLYRWIDNGWVKVDTDIKLYSETGNNADGAMTQAATTTALGTKQDTLTAGANVSIDANNEISATDTTYSNFSGTDGTTAGTAGLVPAPATTDDGKFLNADGSWTAVPPANFATGEAVSSLGIYAGSWQEPENLIKYKYLPINASTASASGTDYSIAGWRISRPAGSANYYGIGLMTRPSWGGGIEIVDGIIETANFKPIGIKGLPFTGSTSQADGVQGMVPKPLAGDEDKVLKGDGTWSTIPAGATVLTNTQFNNLWENA